MYHSDILMVSEEGQGRRGGWELVLKVARTGLEWNQNNICPNIYLPSLLVVVTTPPRGFYFSLATQLICTNYSLLIEITLDQSILGGGRVLLLNNYIALRGNLFRMCRAN